MKCLLQLDVADLDEDLFPALHMESMVVSCCKDETGDFPKVRTASKTRFSKLGVTKESL